MGTFDLRYLNPIQLAFIGDAVCDLFVRERLVRQSSAPMKSLHRRAVGYVNAASQSAALSRVEPLLDDEERDIIRRGRNAKTSGVPRHAAPADYARATAFESLLGYLYLAGRSERLQELLNAAYPAEDE